MADSLTKNDEGSYVPGAPSNVAEVVEEPAVAAGGGGPPLDYAVPFESLEYRVPEVTDPDIPKCVRETVNECFLDLTWDVAFQAADVCKRAGRKVVSAEDMERAIDRITSGQTDAGTSLRRRLNRVREHHRAAARFHPYGRAADAVDDGGPSAEEGQEVAAPPPVPPVNSKGQ